jgi:hypothetical protein
MTAGNESRKITPGMIFIVPIIKLAIIKAVSILIIMVQGFGKSAHFSRGACAFDCRLAIYMNLARSPRQAGALMIFHGALPAD